MTRRRLLAGLLTLIMVLQALVPGAALAKSSKPLNDNLITIGKLTKKDYPQIDKDTALRVAREQKNKRKGFLGRGITLFSADSPYITGQQPGDADKPKYLANITGKVEAKGLDGGNFDWNKIFGDKPIKLELRQLDKTKLDKQTNPLGETGLILTLEVSKAGEFKLTDRAGNLTDLPLFSAEGNPFEYQIQVDRKSYENVELIISTNAGTPGSSFQPVGEKQIATLSFTIGIQQLASTKFTSEWHTGVAEANRPQIEGYFKVGEDLDNDFNFPKNDTTRTILRSGFLENFVEDEENGPWAFIDSELEAAPKSVEVKTDTTGLTFEEAGGIKTVTSGDHKFKYDFTYDVIDGGKLTMTEILPVTFDANGGKFASITDPNAEQKIKSEVEYEKDVTAPEAPTKDRETFKGWGTKDAQGNITPITEGVFKNIKETKTLYAIWSNNDIVADQLEVKESFKDGDTWVNAFIPSLDTLKGQVKIKDAKGVPQPLTNNDKLQILDDSGNPIVDTDLKDKLYEKLKEDDGTEVSRKVTLKAKVTHANGTSQTVDIPIKVIKNIYKADTNGDKPNYVPKDYVKVTVDPTTKAKEPQKYFYYVNPKASVVIPGKDPVGTGNNQFTKWLIKGTETEYKLADHPRHKFTEAETTIEAQYVSDVIPQEGTDKPSTVPSNFVSVKFVPTDKATDTAEKIYWVNPEKEVTIPVKDPVGKQYFTFKEWKIGDVETGETYKVGTPKQFTNKNGTTITATYTEAENIIPYDPNEPTTRPDGYVRVTFAADPGLKLTEQKAYYVKNNAKITLKAIKGDTTNYGYPGVTADTGYKFKEWDKKDDLVIEAADIVVTAKATKLDNVIPEEKEDGTPNEKPKGYNTVTFVIKADDEAKGSLEGVTKFYVNPTEYAKITPPEAKPNTGYVFGSWDKDTTIPTVYDKDTTITGSFNELGAVIPKTNPDGTENKQPAGYNTVTFKLQTYHGKEAGQFVDGETTVYFVNPAKKVTIPQPKTSPNVGYKFSSWNPDPTTPTNYTMKNTEIWGRFEKIGDVIPSTDATGKPNPKPEGYVTVIFTKGKHGKSIEGKTIYYVNPDGNTQLKHMTSIADNRVNRPVVTPDVGYKFSGWSKDADHVIKSDLVVSANYLALDDVIPKDKPTGGENKKPDDYITVTFKTTDKAGSVEKVVYVNPEKAVALDSYAPKVNPITGYEFADWDRPIKEKIQYADNDVITAQFNEIGNVSKVEKPGYVKVEFKQGDHGTLKGDVNLWIKPGVEVTIPAPDVNPNIGYKFDKWNKDLTVNLAADAKTYVITAKYEALDNIIPQKNTDGSDKPKGYKTVKFVGEHGTLAVDTVFYVNPEAVVDFTNTVKGFTKTPDFSYTEVGGTWSSEDFNKKFTEDTTFTFTFAKLADVIPEEKPDGTSNVQPKDYVKVTLIPTDKATDKTNKVFFVNPKENVVIPSTNPVGKEITDANGNTYTFTFKEWTSTKGIYGTWKPDDEIKGTFIQNTEITAQYTTEVKIEKLIPAPVPKKNVVTPKGDVPDASTLIENKDKMPDGTTFTYTDDGTPDVKNPGDTTAKVKVEYPNGETVVVNVPVKVVDNVVPQTSNEKPKVPDNYVKITVDTTNKATANTKFTKVFWVKPGVEVTIPDIQAPTGKPETVGGVTKTNIFDKWQRQGTPAKSYETDITDTFTKDTTIVATYTVKDNVPPQGKDNLLIPQGSNPSPKDFIKNPYDDNDPNNPNNLPPGTKFEFLNGNPDTSKPGEGKTTIKVIYPNGEEKTVEVPFRVTDDVVEQPDPNDPNTKPAVPDNFVKVTVDPTDQAKDSTKHVFWVNPEKIVEIPADSPTANDGNKIFKGWDSPLKQQFRGETTIKATFGPMPRPTSDYVFTEQGVQPTPQDYKNAITPPAGKRIKDVQIVERPNVDKPGKTSATVKVIYEDGTTDQMTVPVFVQKKDAPTPDLRPYPVPGDCNNRCDQPNQPNQPNVGKDALNTTDHYQYLIGYPDGNFGPNKGMTRAEAATMFTRLLNERPVKWRHYDAGLSDIRPGDWYANTVGYAVQRGIVSGYPDGSFKPNKPITRAEFAAIASRFDALAQGNAISFSDLAPSHWGYNAIRSAATKGWISGYPDNTFRPEQAITRAEVTAITNRMLNRHADLYWIDAHPSEVIRFGDVKRSDWYFEPIMEATMGHDFIRDRDKKTEHWTGINGKSFI